LSKRAALLCWTVTGDASGHSTVIFVREVPRCAHEGVGKGDAYCRVIGQAADEADPAVWTLKATYYRGEIAIAASQGLTLHEGA